MFNKKQKFSIKKFTVGVVSVCLGFSFVDASSSLVEAKEVSSHVHHEQNSTLEYNYISYDELTEKQKNAVIEGTPDDLKQSDKVYYFVYKPNEQASNILPKTGLNDEVGYLLSGLGLLVLAFGVSKNKKKVMSSLLVLTLVGTSVAYPIETRAANNLLANFNKQLKVEAGSLNSAIINIPGYKYYGYFLVAKGNKIAQNNNFNNNDKFGISVQDNIQKLVPNNSLLVMEPINIIEKIPNNYPTVQLPEYKISENENGISLSSGNPPVVDLPKAEVEVKVPDNAPTVDLPDAEVEVKVPSNPPVVDLPVAEIGKSSDNPPVVDLPKAEVEVKVPDNAPTVDLPDAEVEVKVPSNPPVVDLPVSEIGKSSDNPPVVDLPEEEVEVKVPSNIPVVDLPVAEIGKSSDNPPVVDLPKAEVEVKVPSNPPVVDLPVEEAEVKVPSNPPVVDLPEVQISEEQVTRVESFSYTEERVATQELFTGEERIITEGNNGERTIVSKVTTVNGEVVKEEVVSSEITKAAVNKVVEYGIKEHRTEVPTTAPTLDLPVAKITTEDVTRTVETPQTSERIEDATMYEGESREEAGRPKIEKVVDRITKVDGVEAKREEVSRTTTQEMVPNRTYVGTKENPIPRKIAELTTLINSVNNNINQPVDTNKKTEESVNRFEQARTTVTNTLTSARQLITQNNLTINELDSMYQQLQNANNDYNSAVSQLQDKIELTDKKIEFKSVTEAYLYKLDENKHMVKILQLDNIPADLSSYHININLEKDKSVWLPVSEIVTSGDSYTVKANLEDHVQFDSTGNMSDTYNIKVAKTTAENGTFTSFEKLVEAIKNNPAGTFVLGSDLTASEIYRKPNDSSYIDVQFSGNLKSKEGSTYTIYDLKKSLFRDTWNATIENIHLGKVDVNDTIPDSVGSLAQSIDTTTIRNVSADGTIFGRKLVGGLVGIADNNSILENTSFTGNISSANSLGGLVGRVTRGSAVRESFADINGSSSLYSSDKMGGLVAELNDDSSIINSFAKGKIANYGEGDASVGGIVGSVFGGTSGNKDKGKIENVVSFVDVVNGKVFIGNYSPVRENEKTITNNFISESVKTDTSKETYNLTTLSKSNAEEKARKMVSISKPNPTLNNSAEKSLSDVPEYNESYKKIYNNLKILTPFYDRYTIVREGNKLSSNSKLNEKELKSVIPYIGNEIATNLFTNVNNINRIRLDYKDGSSEFLTVSNPTEFKNTGIFDYNIQGLNVMYHPNQFVKDNTELINKISELISNKNYEPTIFNPANLMDWEEKARQPKIEKLYLKESFNAVKPEMKRIIAGLLDNTAVGDYSNGKLKSYIEQYLKDQQNALLIGSTYLNRWYNFAETKDELLFALSHFDRDKDALDLVVKLGNESIDSLKSHSTQTTYNQILSHYTGYSDVLDFVKNRYEQTKENNETINDWISRTTKAYIVTRNSKERPEVKGDIFERLSRLEFQYMLLPLLSIKEKHVYGIVSSNSVVFGIYDSYLNDITKNDYRYNQKVAEIDKKVNETADAIQRYFDVLYRILNKESVDKLIKTNLQVFDATRRGSGEYNWSPEYGDDAFDSVKAFIAPLKRWQQYANSSAYAPVLWNTELVYFAQRDLLSDEGWSTLTHEHMHNLDDKVILNGYGKRFGHGAESYARGLFQSPQIFQNTFGMNLIFETAETDKNIALHNYSPDRFKSMDDFNKYMERVFDVIYTLDLAEAEAMKYKGVNYIKQNYKILTPIDDVENHKSEVLTSIGGVLTGKELNFETFVNAGIVSKLIPDQTFGRDDYISVPMFAAQYGIMENPNGVSGGLTFRRVAFELLAEKGYYEGMVPYISNQYAQESLNQTGHAASDTFILKKIFNDTYKSYKEFRIAMLNKRKEKANDIKSFQMFLGNNPNHNVNGYNDIVNILKQEMSKNNPNAVQTAKEAMYRALLKQTNEFRESIYKSEK